MDEDGSAGDAHGERGVAQDAQARQVFAAADEIDGVGERAAQREQHPPPKRRPGGQLDGLREGQRQAQVGEEDGTGLPPLHAAAQEDGRQGQHHGGVGEQDESAKAGGEVVQRPKVEEAGGVVAEQAQYDDVRPLAGQQGGVGGAVLAVVVPARRQVEGQGEGHAQRYERDAVHVVAVGEFDEDGLAAVRHSPYEHEGDGDADGVAGGGGGLHGAKERKSGDMGRWCGGVRNPFL